ncbi:SsgA family sporulation/cell division regulator [Nakamurella multipartita]|uniref:Sporulation and cell division protein SsgA n=1 Tax=Nakamurella multipartita (strain ATCC 700099 / DSM 44233 / CIP 104796 / JCM 9543 / NBRC 105858 / Y-104) TaxID=479431 RepID=C8XEP9_NAKMY|nr:SsgA family sporulation/cell division regulator [Nakamurella multipartita]ACV79800.1 sporulation and cell division protein SsgA [Nakamurella multipartita DSM 44233]
MYDFNTVEYRMTATVTEMVLISDPTMPPVHAELRYRSDDPFAVQLLLSIDQSPAITWVFGRDLLVEGVQAPAGIGDVQVFPVLDGTVIELRSGEQVASLLAHTQDLAAFLDHSIEIVPSGSESAYFEIEADLRDLPIHDAFEA